MIDGALSRQIRPMVTLHHTTGPRWFAQRGGWAADGAVESFLRYVDVVAGILGTGVSHVCTINEPNVMGVVDKFAQGIKKPFDGGALPEPGPVATRNLITAHHSARELIRRRHPHIQVGWSVAMQCYQSEPDAEAATAAFARPRETIFVDEARNDDWIGVQSYTRTRIGVESGRPVPREVPTSARRTLTGWEFYPAALGAAVRDAYRSANVPIIVTENGIATDDVGDSGLRDRNHRAGKAEGALALPRLAIKRVRSFQRRVRRRITWLTTYFTARFRYGALGRGWSVVHGGQRDPAPDERKLQPYPDAAGRAVACTRGS